MKYTFEPKNVCSRAFEADIQDGIIKEFKINGGCPGNTQGICNLIKGMKINEVISKLKGIDCHGKGTSCPDQIAVFLESISK